MTMLCNARASAGASGIDTGDIGHSLRFRSAANASLSRTFGSTGNQSVWTFSCWAKYGALTAYRHIFLAGASDAVGNLTGLSVGAGNTYVLWWNSAKAPNYSTPVWRDPTAHIHITLVANTSTFTLFINNQQVLQVAKSGGGAINGAVLHKIGSDVHVVRDFFDGYLSRVCFVDGQALTPSSFGYLNTEINEWVSKSQAEVKAVVDASGTNRFMLDFDNATSLTTLGYDTSSKGNNWTLKGFSLTAGATYDWMVDVPGGRWRQ